MTRVHLFLCGLLLGAGAAVADELQNANFEDGLSGWTVQGNVTIEAAEDNQVALFQENPEGAASKLEQVFNLPGQPESLTFTYVVGWFPSADPPRTFPSDSFSVFVLDPATGDRLIPPSGQPPAAIDDFFFADNEELIEFEPGFVTVSQPDVWNVRTVTVDLTSLPGGREVRLEFGLAGGPDGFNSYAIIDGLTVRSVNLPPTCDADGPYVASCGGATTAIQLSGTPSSDPDGDPLDFLWTSTCPGASYDDAEISSPMLTVDTSPGCAIDCLAVLAVSDGIHPPVSCDADVSISDTTDPTLSGVPGDVTVECEAIPEPDGPTASDDCDPSPTIDLTETWADGNCLGNYTLTRTWTATDDCGNSVSQTQVITAQDTTPPDINCPEDVTLECPADTSVEAVGWATADDACAESVAINYSDVTVPGPGQTGRITRTFTAVDDCSNESWCNQIIDIVDTTPPEFTTSPADMTVECDSNGNETELDSWLAAPWATDLCGVVTFANDFVALSDECGETGSTTVTWTATDEHLNSSARSATFTIVDETLPVLTLDTTPIVVVDTDCSGDEAATLPAAATTDNCGPVEVVNDAPATFPADVTTTVTYTATDECDNTVSETLEVTVTPGDDCDTPEARPCDVDGDGDVDRCDLNEVLAGRGQPGDGPDDPRDLDGDGWITVLDARICVTLCDVPRCKTCIDPGEGRPASQPEATEVKGERIRSERK